MSAGAKAKGAVLLLLAALALAGCGGDETTTPEVTSAAGVRELANVLDLRADFEADAGKPRVLFLFSPT
jgi:ABC-type glycerol-3-phosphate transport system substrate-binding protein